MFTKLVRAVEVIAVAGFVVMVVLLFVRQPAGKPAPSASANGAQLFAQNCSGCHGAQGQGGVGPKLNDGRAKLLYSTAAAEATFVKRGGGSMPAFATRLSDAQIDAVVEFTRSGL